jgi:hypothetical protein
MRILLKLKNHLLQTPAIEGLQRLPYREVNSGDNRQWLCLITNNP